MNKELLQAQLQMCQMLQQIGALQQQVAQLQTEKFQSQLAQLTQNEHDAAADERDLPSGAPVPA